MFCKRGDSGRAGRGKLGKFASGRRLIFIFPLFYVTYSIYLFKLRIVRFAGKLVVVLTFVCEICPLLIIIVIG